MQISQALFDRMLTLWRDNVLATVWGDDDAFLRAVKQPFSPSLDLVLGDLSYQTTLMNWGQYLLDSGNVTPILYDAVSGDGVVSFEGQELPEQFHTTGSGSPFTIYGWAFIRGDGTVLEAVEQMETPVPVTKTAQFITHMFCDFRFPTNMVR
jgi:hypothetical protein